MRPIKTAGINAIRGPKFGIKLSKPAIRARVRTSGIPTINRPMPVKIAITKMPFLTAVIPLLTH